VVNLICSEKQLLSYTRAFVHSKTFQPGVFICGKAYLRWEHPLKYAPDLYKVRLESIAWYKHCN